MARIAGVDLPSNKKILIALTYIYGIGVVQSRNILNKVKIDINQRTNELSEEQMLSIRILRNLLILQIMVTHLI